MGVLADRAYLIETGSVKLIRQVGGRVEEVDHLGPGRIMGAAALIARRLSTTDIGAVALEPTEVTILSREEWFKLRDSLPGVIRSFIKGLLERPAQTLSGGQSQASYYPLGPICHLLRIMAQGAGREETPQGKPRTRKSRIVVLDYDTAIKGIKEILGIPLPAVVSSLKKLDSFDLIKLKPGPLAARGKAGDPAACREEGASPRPAEFFLEVTDPEQMPARLNKLVQELPELALGPPDCLDIFDLADLLETEPELICQQMARSRIPPEIFMFHRDAVMRCIKEVGRDFFRGPGPGGSSPRT